MTVRVRVNFLGEFGIFVDGKRCEATFGEKRTSLLRLLVLQRGKGMLAHRLISELDMNGANPENALKTLVSRTRAQLNEVCDGLGNCIVSEAGKYCWKSVPEVSVDALEALELLDQLAQKPFPDEVKRLTRRLMDIYNGEIEGEYWLHRKYLESVYAYIDLLRGEEAYNRILEVCHRAMEVDDLDEHLHILYMEALVNLKRHEEALAEYRKLVKQTQEYFCTEESDELRESYARLFEQSQRLVLNLDVIHNELMEEEQGMKGPFFCDYQSFKTIYNIQIRNIERLGSTMFLGVLQVEGPSTASREGGMAVLLEVLRANLRKGDIVTRFSETMVAMLLPSVNYSTGNTVMERIEKVFFSEFPAGMVSLRSKISPLGGY